MTKQDVLNSTARRIAQTHTVEQIEREYKANIYSGGENDEITSEIFGCCDPLEWLDMSGEEMTDMLKDEGITRNTAEIAADLMMCAAWLEASND